MNKRVVIANDHGAVELKNEISIHLQARGYEVVNLGVDNLDSVDYPDMALSACREYLGGNYEFGVVCCGTGIGISISANKIDGIRCALLQNIFAAQMAKEHNNVNFIAFGGRINYQEPVTQMIDAFIDATAQSGRHANRVRKIMDLEHTNY
ncbi:MAG: RpiB/LacA/LacB family sugar-phosphate isomerase [Spirochaetales bacterium]|jgi:ribose 5-phosphate isomerase B|nr:RpiB/LacA/LacB family sugar-phosphate isomerase [Spirochaetales bacterium]